MFLHMRTCFKVLLHMRNTNKVAAITVAAQLDLIYFVVKIRYMSNLWKIKFYERFVGS